MLSQHLFDEIIGGQVPDELNTLTGLGKVINRVTRHGTQILALVVAKARLEHLPSASEWSQWAQEEFDITGNYLHHLHRIGKMLLLLLADAGAVAHYRLMFELDYDRLYAISAIATLEPKQLSPFLSHHNDLPSMKREAVRDAVRRWLGEPVAERLEQPKLPGFEDSLEVMKQLKAADFVRLINDDERADASLRAGLGLLGAALQVKKHAEVPDVVTLSRAKAALQAELAEIEEAIARAADAGQSVVAQHSGTEKNMETVCAVL